MRPILTSKMVRPEQPGSRERTQEMIKRFNEADQKLKEICREKGLELPVIVCGVN